MQNFYCKNFVIMQTIANIFDKYYINITKQLNNPKKLRNNACSKKVIEAFEIHRRERDKLKRLLLILSLLFGIYCHQKCAKV